VEHLVEDIISPGSLQFIPVIQDRADHHGTQKSGHGGGGRGGVTIRMWIYRGRQGGTGGRRPATGALLPKVE
jgi:hypothetical protein